jgi:NAD(P)-dependent dehydrogenase (short-subunit alcohol dehydrogenase family)
MRTIVITGGTGDLGHGVVPRLTRDYRCAVVYRSAESWQRLTAAIDAELIGLDSLDRAGEVAPIHGLVHLAGGFTASSTPDDFVRMFETNVLPAVQALAAVVPHLAEGGRIIAVSAAASLTKPAGLAAYTTSKAALNSLIETTAKELRSRRITANALLPTILDTAANRKSTPSDKLVSLDHIAETIAFLLSDAASNVTGQLLVLSAE